jgi:hypothetical protein
LLLLVNEKELQNAHNSLSIFEINGSALILHFVSATTSGKTFSIPDLIFLGFAALSLCVPRSSANELKEHSPTMLRARSLEVSGTG